MISKTLSPFILAAAFEIIIVNAVPAIGIRQITSVISSVGATLSISSSFTFGGAVPTTACTTPNTFI
ncbi:hypothetical protein J3R30DRAFT_3436707 [Lentinula aciculospora]|uniref:Uncharacterized protein n=1 Tax=Lentinula aciculospora TaxID=153920 RepID=A0A9W9ASD0_9AGAR|nr:hypothetical protein J3R30DRAFT_3428856 [Lentinula aciculospora]KAJ4488531.1 hypothetical protein J3R30DRAFT_3436707 [Lentinula aciculospora]